MPKLSIEEYNILKNKVDSSDTFEWIARDSSPDSLYLYGGKPFKDRLAPHDWDSSLLNATSLVSKNHLFEFVKSTDEEPTYIPDLIGEFENDRIIKETVSGVEISKEQADYLESFKVSAKLKGKQYVIFRTYSTYFSEKNPDIPFELWNVRGGTLFNTAVWYGYSLRKKPEYFLKVSDNLYFKSFDETVILSVMDDFPGSLDEAKVFKSRKEAEEARSLIGGEVVEVVK